MCIVVHCPNPSLGWRLQGRRALPSQRYLRLLQGGAEEHGLAEGYRQYLEQLQPFQAGTLRKRAGATLMAFIFLATVAPVFATQRLWAKLTGMSAPGSGGTLHAQWTARYLHSVFALAWQLHDALEPVCGSGCHNEQEGCGP